MPKSTFFNLSEEKKQRIIEGTKKAFSEKKYKDVTIDSIVSYSQIPKGSFYQYFNNKDDLFKYLFSDLGLSKKKELIEELGKSEDRNFVETIVDMIQRATKFENQDQEMKDLKDRFTRECPQELKNEILSDIIPDTIDLFKCILSKFIEKKHFRKDFNVDIASYLLTSFILNIEKYPGYNEKNYGDILVEVCEILENGLISRR